MPLLNSMGILRNMGINNSVVPSYFMYMYSGSESPINQNNIAIASYDNIQGKLASINARDDQLLALTNTSEITFNGTKTFLYSYYTATYNNNSLWWNSSEMESTNLGTYSTTRMTGTLTNTSFGAIMYDNSGNIIQVIHRRISSVNYITVSKFNQTGTIFWQKKYTYPNTNGLLVVKSICVDSSDNIYFCGNYDPAGTEFGTTGMWGRVTNAGVLSYLKTQNTLQMTGVKCIGSTLYFSMALTTSQVRNYITADNLSTAEIYIGAASTSTGSFSTITKITNPAGNNLAPIGIAVDPTDSSNIFMFGFIYNWGSSIPSSTGFIFKFNGSLSTLSSKEYISFTPNAVANPTYIYNRTFIDNIFYQASSNSYYLSGTTVDSTASTGNYMNSFMLRGKVNTSYTGTILNRTYNIASLTTTYNLTNVTAFAGTSQTSVTSDTTFTLTPSITTMNGYSTVPTKVNL